MMKKFKKSIAWFFTIIFMMPMIWSCSQANDITEPLENQKYQDMAKSIIESREMFKELYKNATEIRTIDYGEISQDDVDYYATMLGHEAGEFDVALVDAILEKYIDVMDRGFEDVLEDYNLTEFTKISMIDIAEGRWIEDIESHPNYDNLSLTEKEMLSLANAYAKELEQRDDLITGEGIGAFFGIIVGAWICNIWCVLGGAIVGGIIGSIVSKNQ